MKNLLIILLFAMPAMAFAQNQGTIIFEEKRKLEFNFDGPNGHQIQSQMPESITSKNELVFNEQSSIFRIYKDQVDDDIQMLNEEEGENMIVKVQRPESFVFRDLKEKRLIESREFFGKKFLITNDQKDSWKILDETRTILGFTCKKAELIRTEEEEPIVAWFTSEIPVSAGPAIFGGLPGMILSLEINEGRLAYTAVEVRNDPIDSSILMAPKSGKKVTRDEFKQIMKERMAEQKEISGSGAMIKIIQSPQ